MSEIANDIELYDIAHIVDDNNKVEQYGMEDFEFNKYSINEKIFNKVLVFTQWISNKKNSFFDIGEYRTDDEYKWPFKNILEKEYNVVCLYLLNFYKKNLVDKGDGIDELYFIWRNHYYCLLFLPNPTTILFPQSKKQYQKNKDNYILIDKIDSNYKFEYIYFDDDEEEDEEDDDFY